MNRTFFIAGLATFAVAITGTVPLLFAESPQQFAAQRRAERLGSAGTISTAASSVSSVPSVRFPVSGDDEAERIAAVDHANPSVVSIIISKDLPNIQQSFETVPFGNGFSIQIPREVQNGTSQQVIGGGTAFFVSSDGLLMTNNHVVSDTTAQYTVLLNDGSKAPATVVSRDSAHDVALIRINRQNTLPLSFAAGSDLHLGQTAIAIGNALGQYRNTVSVGVVSGIGRDITAATDQSGNAETLSEVIQTDAAINAGNSGGPILNLAGEVIGMSTARDVQAQNIGFAIPTATLQQVLNAYRQ